MVLCTPGGACQEEEDPLWWVWQLIDLTNCHYTLCTCVYTGPGYVIGMVGKCYLGPMMSTRPAKDVCRIFWTYVSHSVGNVLCIVSTKLQKILLSPSTQPTFFTLTFRSLSEAFIRRSLFNSSSSCHDSDATWQEIGRMCGSACGCPRRGSRIIDNPWTGTRAVLLFCLVDLPPLTPPFIAASMWRSGKQRVSKVVRTEIEIGCQKTDLQM